MTFQTHTMAYVNERYYVDSVLETSALLQFEIASNTNNLGFIELININIEILFSARPKCLIKITRILLSDMKLCKREHTEKQLLKKRSDASGKNVSCLH